MDTSLEDEQQQPGFTDKIMKQMKKHPLIPGGMLATCGALGMAFRRMNQRDSVGYQRWLRARVLAQGLTVVAIIAAGIQEMGVGVLTGQAKAIAPPTTSPHETREFEKRLREAEAAHRAETGTVPRGPIPDGAESRSSQKPLASTTQDRTLNSTGSRSPPDAAPSTTPSSRSPSWLSWLGISKS